MIRISVFIDNRWQSCHWINERLITDGDVEINPIDPLMLDVRFTNIHGQTTRDLDHAIPRWADASGWNKARATVTELREFGYIK